MRRLLLWGMLAGFCGGLLAAGFALVAGEGAIESSIRFEERRAATSTEGHRRGHGGSAAQAEHDAAAEPVSRAVQEHVGLPVASSLYGAALGGIFAIAFVFALGRVGGDDPGRTALWMALCGFAVVFLLPFLKYPANPPGVGSAETVGSRTELYLLMIGISLTAAIGAFRVRRWFAARVSGAAAALLAVATYLGLVLGAMVVLPGVNEVPSGFPADTLWTFRGAAVGTQAVLWGAMGLLFAWAARRVTRGSPPPRRSPGPS